MHWSDSFSRTLKGRQLISTGISPSGHIHVGNMREILTGDMIYRAALDHGLESRLIYLCDDMDPLRKVYPFLDASYQKYVGMPLFDIPAPDGSGTKYSEYFLSPFLEVLNTVDVKADVIRTRDLYANGSFEKAIDIAMRHSDDIRNILETVSGRKIETPWEPYNPICSNCGKINSTTVTGYSNPLVSYRCSCGNAGSADIRKAEGKMPWRIEWPAKWYILGVTVEPFGKDHGAPGGSYDTGKLIAKEVFGIEPPRYIIYERILLKGKGAMHSSTGNVIPAFEMTKFAPPEILRYLIARVQPERHIDFEPSMGLLNLIDEYEKLGEEIAGSKVEEITEDQRRAFELSSIRGRNSLKEISFRHLVTLVQIYGNEEDLDMALKRNGVVNGTGTEGMDAMIQTVRQWVSLYAPETVKFSIIPQNSNVTLTEVQKNILKDFLGKIDTITWVAEDIHNSIHELIKKYSSDPKEGFGAFYQVLIGRDKGPRLGYFLSNMDRNWLKDRITKNI